MFFALSKIAGVFLNPIVWIAGLLITAIFVSNPKLKKRLLIIDAALLLFFTNPFLMNKIIGQWEKPPVNDSTLNPVYTYGIVLSGMVWYDSETDHVNFLQSSDRIWQAVRLYKQGFIEKIVISGGDAGFFKKDMAESILLKNFLLSIGIPGEDVITEELSRNTHENALFTSQLLGQKPNESYLLITSAIHLKRAELCFRKVGFICHSYPTDCYTGKSKQTLMDILIPSERALINWNSFIHELFGMLSYKMMGYI